MFPSKRAGVSRVNGTRVSCLANVPAWDGARDRVESEPIRLIHRLLLWMSYVCALVDHVFLGKDNVHKQKPPRVDVYLDRPLEKPPIVNLTAFREPYKCGITFDIFQIRSFMAKPPNAMLKLW